MNAWAEREPDETTEDWMLRLQISFAAMEAGPLLIPIDRNIQVPERTAS